MKTIDPKLTSDLDVHFASCHLLLFSKKTIMIDILVLKVHRSEALIIRIIYDIR